MNALFDLPDGNEDEHAVIAHFRLSDDRFGSPDDRQTIYEAERIMTTAVEEAGVGEVDGDEFGGGEVVVYAYGADADALFAAMEPALRALPFRPAHVLLRRGAHGTDSRVDL